MSNYTSDDFIHDVDWLIDYGLEPQEAKDFIIGLIKSASSKPLTYIREGVKV